MYKCLYYLLGQHWLQLAQGWELLVEMVLPSSICVQPILLLAWNKYHLDSRYTLSNKIQCTLDIATGLRHGGWGRYRQRGRYLCNARAPRSIGVEVAIGSAAAISKVAISNGHCTVTSRNSLLSEVSHRKYLAFGGTSKKAMSGYLSDLHLSERFEQVLRACGPLGISPLVILG